jgi:hypothetical protein
MKRLVLISIICILFGNVSQAQNLHGNWKVTNGRIFPMVKTSAGHIRSTPDYIEFSSDTLRIRSGIFYLVHDQLAEDYYFDKYKRYPFCYYGYSTTYRLKADTLQILYPPFQKWLYFHANFRDSSHLVLTSVRDTIQLERIQAMNPTPVAASIDYIKAHVFDIRFLLSYDVTIYPPDHLKYKQQAALEKKMTKWIKLPHGYFNYVLQGFSLTGFKIDKSYPGTPDSGSITLIIKYKDGSVLTSEIQGIEFPRELELALIPLIYAHQKYLYKDKPILPTDGK